ncbi:cysteine desulfurase family protein [Tumidithrix elongata RA019]|uniref:cysteine desulfurase n=1 Tax=Tumidithrix elongata BACA0141 TaxID=2716417 RepID=A0AAW9PZC9_9CYAN|nr:cysteine desulfurase family protein [Tumidithrix elongata RA019]
MQIYLDHGATTPTRPEVIDFIGEVMRSQWGNPSSLHAWGERAAMTIERSRLQVASLIGAEPEGIIFTSGGTESDNLALFGVARNYCVPQHAIVSAVEHSAISEPAKFLEQMGWEITRLPVDRMGRVHPKDLSAALRPNTVLVSVIYAQNEVGTIQPIEKLGQICRNAGVLFHTDAVQAAGRLPIDLRSLPIDLLSISSHKLYGPQGVGALYVNATVKKLLPLLMGGGQEEGLRSGTQAVAAIAGFGLAADLAQQELVGEFERLMGLRDRLFHQLKDIPDLEPTGDYDFAEKGGGANRLPHHLSFCHPYLNGRRLVTALNLAGIAISSGSACSSGSLVPSSTLLAMGFNQAQALGSIRLTLGRDTTEADVDWTALVLRQVIERELMR